ncbi:uncharacterized protein RJT21DRAFT_122662 [Scheffersomyces amazonensis]|uniref:uncharacterized protein n=1 Tax=Scheffersomyces amazonensis TaxID=1078765 RepID=UPI00315D2A58
MSKNIIVFGAHGKIGQLFVTLASNQHKVSAVVRNHEQASQINSIASVAHNVKSHQLTIDEASVEEISHLIKGHDVVVFTAGSAGKNLLQVDLDGAVKTFEASVLANVRRYILISAIHAESRQFIAKSPIKNYYIAKHYADRILINEFNNSLDFTILKPTQLVDNKPTGKIQLFTNDNEPIGTVTRADVASVILKVIGLSNTFGKSYNFANGTLSIDNESTYN